MKFKHLIPLPSKVEDIGLMKQIALREKDPILYQNLFRDNYIKPPCDTANRLRNGNSMDRRYRSIRQARVDCKS